MNEIETIKTIDVITVSRKTPIYDALEILLENDITGLPVVDDDMTLVGIITEKDILKLLSVLENNSATVEDFMTKEVVNDAKLNEIKDILDKSDQVVIWFYWKAYGKYLGEHIDSSMVIDGDVSPAKRQGIVNDFRSGKFKVLIASQGTLAEGFNLQNAHVQIFANVYYDSIKYYQSISRLYRNGQKNKVVTYVLIGKGSIENEAWNVLSQKMDMARANNYLQGVLTQRYGGKNA